MMIEYKVCAECLFCHTLLFFYVTMKYYLYNYLSERFFVFLLKEHLKRTLMEKIVIEKIRRGNG